MAKYFIEEISWSLDYDFQRDLILLDFDTPVFLTTPYDTLDNAKKAVEELVAKNMFDVESFRDIMARNKNFDHEHVMKYVIITCEIEQGGNIDSKYLQENYENIDGYLSYMAVPPEMNDIITLF